MDWIFVVVGAILIGIIVAVFIMYKKGFNLKLWGVQIKHWLIVIGIVVAVLAIMIVKIALGKKSDKIEDLLIKLRKSQADGDLRVIDEKLQNNQNKAEKINTELEGLEAAAGVNKKKIDNLNKKKANIDSQLEKINGQYSDKKKQKDNLEDKVARMKKRLNK